MRIPIIKVKDSWLLGKRTIGITFFPFILLKKSYFDKQSLFTQNQSINHEKIHIKQQGEMLVVFFYLWYFVEYFLRIFGKSNPYTSLSFEKEAYENENNLNYLKTRKFWSFIKYL